MPKLLVIDDDPDMRSILVDMLEEAGHEVLSAADGTAGVALAREHSPDLILCDIVMSGLDGYGVLSALRQGPNTELIPVIFLTGVGGDTALRKGMNLGADDYLVKPVTQDVLVETVRARLGRSLHLRREAGQRIEDLRIELARSFLPHELLTPLTTVMGLSSLLMEEAALETVDVQEAARTIFLASQRLEEMATRFLLYAELQTAERTGQLPQLDLDRARAVISRAARGKATRVGREADLKLEIKAFAGMMTSDHLAALVEELVGNALKFSKPSSDVTVHCGVDGDACVLSVRDRGRGMSHEQLSGLAEHAPFLRRHQEQPGLGLSIVRRLVALYGGDVVFFDRTPGPGTTARVRLPVRGDVSG